MFLAGCAVGPNYKRPGVAAPETFRGEMVAGTNSFADLPWWEVFHDPALQGLIRAALTNNYDLRIAYTRVEQARQAAAEARAGLFPQVNYNGLAGGGRNVVPSAGGAALSPTHTNGTLFSGNINASWEIDLWGRVRRLTESARAQYFASEEARRDVTVSLIAQVAQDYFQLLELDRQLAIQREATNSFGQSLNIFDDRLRHGAASKLETSSAEALLDSAAANIPDLESQIAQQENLLNYLIGTNPGPVVRAGSALENQSPPEVPAGLPSDLLERRPDIREAEQLLRSANAQVGVAKANFFPQINLTGALGAVSPQLGMITAGSAAAWGVAAGITGPIFQGGQLRAQFRQAKAAWEQNALQFQSAALNAFQEVSSALIARQKLAESDQQQVRAVAAYREAFQIATERYRNGQSSYYEVLQEQQLLFPAESAEAQTRLNQLSAVIQLYRALGGGWQR